MRRENFSFKLRPNASLFSHFVLEITGRVRGWRPPKHRNDISQICPENQVICAGRGCDEASLIKKVWEKCTKILPSKLHDVSVLWFVV